MGPRVDEDTSRREVAAEQSIRGGGPIEHEPFAGLDPISLGTAAQLIRRLNDTLGITSIVVSHDLEETFRIADRVIILGNGKIAAQGTPDEVRSSDDPLVRQFVNALPEGPVHFHYPGPTVAEDFSGGLQK